MKLPHSIALVVLVALMGESSPLAAESTNEGMTPIDLPAVLRLAGANNLDVRIAREKLREAEANRSSAVEQFFPWVAPGIGYHRRDGLAQAVPAGTISDANFQSFQPGITAVGQLDFGEAIFKTLETKKLVLAASQGLETRRQDSILAAAQAYFELVKARNLIGVREEALKLSRDYERELESAVAAGVAFKGDALRVRAQSERLDLALQKTREDRRVAAANLALMLRLDPRADLAPADALLAPLEIVDAEAALESLLDQALASRPEIRERAALLAAARDAKRGAVYGPLIPFIGAQAFGGGLGGGADNGPSNFGPEGDIAVTLGWRIGPGGLFDSGRVNASKARFSSAQLEFEKIRDVIAVEVVTDLTRVRSLGRQIESAKRELAAASESLRLTQARKQYGVGVVLEDIQAQQDLNQARAEFVTTLADHAKAQYALRKATGGLDEAGPVSSGNRPPKR